MKKRQLLVFTALFALITVVAVSQPSSASTSLTFSPDADAYVSVHDPSSNFGASTRERIDGSPVVESFIRFTTSGITSPVLHSTLSFYNRSSSNSGYVLHAVSDNGWSEDSITYRSAPAIGAVIGSAIHTKTGTWTTFDVSQYIKGNGVYSFALTKDSSTAVALVSKDGESQWIPQLSVEMAGGSGSSPSPTSTAGPGGTATSTPTSGSQPGISPSGSIRAAFYYPWFPEAWNQRGINPFTNYDPTLGNYDSGSVATIKQHIAAMQYGKISAGISSWWGVGDQTDLRVPALLSAAAGTGFGWTLYYENESQGDPSSAQINSDLTYIRDHYASDPSFLKIDGRFVVFVYADGGDGCGMADRWKAGNTVNAYIVLKVFPGYRNCSSQPDSWHQYSPAVATDSQAGYSYAISPGFWEAGQSVRLPRDLTRWQEDVKDMAASGAQFQLITTFNEWGEGTAVESAKQWQSSSGYGAYLDVLHNDGVASGASSDASPTAVATATKTPAPGPTTPVPTNTPAPTATTPSGGDGSATLLAVGDIASCSSSGDEQVAALMKTLSGPIALLGDIEYEKGSAAEFAQCFDPAWGPLKSRIHPAPGNHEYGTPGASGYYGYFGAAAGDPAKGYYSYDLGSWHIIALNSNCSAIGGCGAGSAQEQWLRADLAAHPASCTLAYWHHPRYSSGGEHGSSTATKALWQALIDNQAEIVLSGHDHDYERFARQDANGSADPSGIREFVVGTGGKSHYTFNSPQPNSEVRNDNTFGTLKLTLNSGGYSWKFIPVAGASFTDSGSDSCVK